jgi:hypothetical protein
VPNRAEDGFALQFSDPAYAELLNSYQSHRPFLCCDVAGGLFQSESVQLIKRQIAKKIDAPVDQLRHFPEMVEGVSF